MAGFQAILNFLNDREEIGKMMHESWSKTKRSHGFHHVSEKHLAGEGVILVCEKCHADLIPWAQLPESQKDINRHAFDDVIAHLKTLSPMIYKEGNHVTTDHAT